MGIKKNSASESEKQYNPGKKQKIRQWFVGNRNSLRARVTINVLNPTKKQTLPITSRENADQSRIPSKATNAQQMLPLIHTSKTLSLAPALQRYEKILKKQYF